MTATVSAVVFDLGKVIVDWDPVAAVAPAFGGDRAMAQAELERTGFMAWNAEQDRGRSWEEGFAAAPDAEARRLFETYRDNIDIAHAPAVPGTATIVERLQGAGVVTYGLTNATREGAVSSRRQHAVLRNMLDIVVSAEEGVNKPDPAIYRALLARTGRAPEDLLFIDDSPKNVAGAEAVGLRSHRFTDAETLEAWLTEEGML